MYTSCNLRFGWRTHRPIIIVVRVFVCLESFVEQFLKISFKKIIYLIYNEGTSISRDSNHTTVIWVCTVNSVHGFQLNFSNIIRTIVQYCCCILLTSCLRTQTFHQSMFWWLIIISHNTSKSLSFNAFPCTHRSIIVITQINLILIRAERHGDLQLIQYYALNVLKSYYFL